MKKLGNAIKGVTCFIGALLVIGHVLDVMIQWLEHARFWRIRKQKQELRAAKKQAGHDVPVKRRVAIITGASSGLGAAYAKQVAAWHRKYDVSEIWLVARRIDRLEAVAQHIDLPVQILAIDLTDDADLDILRSELRHEREVDPNFQVSMLINCAGYGIAGASTKLGYQAEKKMIELNDRAAVAMTDMVIPYMKIGGRILEICSIASFRPIPFFNAYASSKAFLYHYSRGFRIELMGKGISVTAVCPYWIHDTEFVGNGDGFHFPKLSSSADSVAKWSLRDAKLDRAVSTPNIVSKGMYLMKNLVPTTIMEYFMVLMRVAER